MQNEGRLLYPARQEPYYTRYVWNGRCIRQQSTKGLPQLKRSTEQAYGRPPAPAPSGRLKSRPRSQNRLAKRKLSFRMAHPDHARGPDLDVNRERNFFSLCARAFLVDLAIAVALTDNTLAVVAIV